MGIACAGERANLPQTLHPGIQTPASFLVSHHASPPELLSVLPAGEQAQDCPGFWEGEHWGSFCVHEHLPLWPLLLTARAVAFAAHPVL